jgi:1-phosphatidylinositol phosphodiesterase
VERSPLFVRTVFTATAAALALVFVTTDPALADSNGGYSHDATTGAANPDWMAALPGNLPISEISIPATHDSGASRAGGDSTLTQSMSLGEQLNAGIRGWDIRLGVESGRLKLYHGIIRQGQDFDTDVLAVADTFLTAHPSETLLMRVRQENGSDSNFGDLVRATLAKDPRVYTGSSLDPTLDTIRGKIIVLSDSGVSADLGIPWSSLNKQDDYTVSTNWNLADKWNAIKKQLDDSQNGPHEKIYANFLSASGGSFPYFIASGHSSPGTAAPALLTGLTRGVINTCKTTSRCLSEYPSVNCFLGTCSVAFEGTDILTMNDLNTRGRARLGLIFADFPGAGLIQAVIDSNGIPTANNTLGFIKTTNTPNGHVEVHLASGLSGYRTRILETPTAFGNENDGVWQLLPDGDLGFIKTSNTPNGHVEVHIASRSSNYQKLTLQTATAFANENDGVWQLLGNGDLAFIKTGNTPDGHVEVHTASRSSNYQTRTLETPTTFANESDGTWGLF